LFGYQGSTPSSATTSTTTSTPTTSTPTTPNIINQNINQYQQGGGGGGITTLDPLTRQTTSLDPNSFLGKTFSKVGDFTGSMMDKFSDSRIGSGIVSGANKFQNFAITPMMALANKRNALNPNAMNYNPNLQPQMDFLGGQTGTRITGTSDNLKFTDGQMMIGNDPNSGLAKYGPGSVLSGQNVVSGFGTNDYAQQLQNYIDKMMGYKTLSNFQRAKLDRAIAEKKAYEDKIASEAAAKALAAANTGYTNRGTKIDYGDYYQSDGVTANPNSSMSHSNSVGPTSSVTGGKARAAKGGIIGYKNGGRVGRKLGSPKEGEEGKEDDTMQIASSNVLGPARKAYNSVYGVDSSGNEILVKDLYDDFESFLEMFKMQYHADGGRVGFDSGRVEFKKGGLATMFKLKG